jgi:hypothetical protein
MSEFEEEYVPTVQEIEINRQASDQSKYRSISAMSHHEFAQHCFDGDDGFIDGSYLIPHPVETFYNYRRKISVYENYFKPIISAMVSPVYSEEIEREISDDSYTGFINDADGCGTSLSLIAEQVLTTAAVQGVAYLVMDNYKELPETELTAIEQRLYPYVYIRGEKDCYEKSFKRNKLDTITFKESDEKMLDGKTYPTYKQWRVDGWEKLYFKEVSGKKEKIIIEQGFYAIGMLPVIPITDFIKDANLSKEIIPPFLSIALYNYFIYNKASQLRKLESAQCHSIFYGIFGGKQFKTGVYNAVDLPVGTTMAPGFASPSGEHHINLSNSKKTDIQNLYAMAENSGVSISIGTEKTADASGISKAYDFRAQESILKKTAIAGQTLEEKIVVLFGKYTNKNIDCSIEYPTEFGPMYAVDRINGAVGLIEKLNPSVDSVLYSKLLMVIVKYFFSEESDREEIELDINNMINDAKQSALETSQTDETIVE